MGRVGFIALTSPPGPTSLTRLTCPILERETGIEPATNSLEGCDSTTELLPPSRLWALRLTALRRGKPPACLFFPLRALAGAPTASRAGARGATAAAKH